MNNINVELSATVTLSENQDANFNANEKLIFNDKVEYV